MSLTASIDVCLSKKNEVISPIIAIDMLIKAGWTLIQNQYIVYLPLGDKDDFNWQSEKDMTWLMLKNILEKKEKSRETIGVIMIWKNTEIGGSFLFWPEKDYVNLSLNFNAFRPMIQISEHDEIINFQWYLERLLPPLHRAFGIEAFSFEQQK